MSLDGNIYFVVSMNPKKFCLQGHGGNIIVNVILTKLATHKNKSTNIMKKTNIDFIFVQKQLQQIW